jgi:tetratricopeptide (TPR) repeat protein
MGRHDEALVVFARMGEACRRHQTCPTLISNICTTLGKVGRSKEGLRACNKLLSGNPNNVGALKAKACCLARLGKYKQSTELFSVLLAKTPNDADLLYNQACAHALAGHSDDAAQSLARAIGINDDYRDMARRDPDFKSIRPTTSFRRVIQIGRRARSGQVLKSPASEKIKGSKCPTRSFSVRASARR